MSENPFSSPIACDGIKPAAPQEMVYQIAKSQRNLNLGIVAYLLLIVFRFVVDSPSYSEATRQTIHLIVGLVGLVVFVTALACLFSLARKLHNTAAAVVFTIIGMIPLIGLFAMFGVSNTATKYLREYGIQIGFLGAGLEQFNQAA